MYTYNHRCMISFFFVYLKQLGVVETGKIYPVGYRDKHMSSLGGHS